MLDLRLESGKISAYPCESGFVNETGGKILSSMCTPKYLEIFSSAVSLGIPHSQIYILASQSKSY